MLEAPNLILIGSAGRNSGKTFLAVELIKRLAVPLAALKITSIEKLDGKCQRGGRGCTACSLNTDFCIEEELSKNGQPPEKDTSLLLAAGAKKVFWLRCLRSKLEQGYAAFSEKIAGPPPYPLVICESNSLRKIIKPKLFIMIMNTEGGIKKSASDVACMADITLQKNFTDAEINNIVSMCHKELL
ncbi:MAG: hypothetical protein Ta2F_10850 [Termitinemataceae bacterium]|nr:MAG: hypothetical protein Ta2F_10850 [Termitinemataceae bacterium]